MALYFIDGRDVPVTQPGPMAAGSAACFGARVCGGFLPGFSCLLPLDNAGKCNFKLPLASKKEKCVRCSGITVV